MIVSVGQSPSLQAYILYQSVIIIHAVSVDLLSGNRHTGREKMTDSREMTMMTGRTTTSATVPQHGDEPNASRVRNGQTTDERRRTVHHSFIASPAQNDARVPCSSGGGSGDYSASGGAMGRISGPGNQHRSSGQELLRHRSHGGNVPKRLLPATGQLQSSTTRLPLGLRGFIR
jgi:hypothetical protein